MSPHTCVHYNGTSQTKCEAGVCYRDVTAKPEEPGSAYRKPCILWGHSPNSKNRSPANEAYIKSQQELAPHCGKFRLPTALEIAADQAEASGHVERWKKLAPLIQAAKEEVKRLRAGDRNIQGKFQVIQCPVCSGSLTIRVAGHNLHSSGACEKGCFCWLE